MNIMHLSNEELNDGDDDDHHRTIIIIISIIIIIFIAIIINMTILYIPAYQKYSN